MIRLANISRMDGGRGGERRKKEETK